MVMKKSNTSASKRVKYKVVRPFMHEGERMDVDDSIELDSGSQIAHELIGTRKIEAPSAKKKSGNRQVSGEDLEK